jgi:hypothetical protein
MDPTPHLLAAFAVRMTEWCAPIPQALPVWDRVLGLQPALRTPRLSIPHETRRDYPEFPRVARDLMPWFPVEPPRALRNRLFVVFRGMLRSEINDIDRVAMNAKFLSKLA